MSPTTVASGPSGPARLRDSRPTRITALSDSAASGLPPGVAALRARPWDCLDVMTLLLTCPRDTDGSLTGWFLFRGRAEYVSGFGLRTAPFSGGARILVAVSSGPGAALARIVCSDRASDQLAAQRNMRDLSNPADLSGAAARSHLKSPTPTACRRRPRDGRNTSGPAALS